MDSGEVGRKGEAVAAKYYLDRGYRLLAHNYCTRQGELDLIVQKQEQIVICEVKTRAGRQLGIPAEAVTPAKQKRILLAAKQFLQENALLDAWIRFDVVEITRCEAGWKVHCIPNAFCDMENPC